MEGVPGPRDAAGAMLRAVAREHRLPERAAWVVVLLPPACFLLWASLMATGPTRRLAFWLLQENHPVELATFALALGGAVLAALHARALHARGAPRWGVGFYLLFGAGLFFLAGEEVAWGQWLFGFETPAALRDLNAQGELTLHNLKGLQGHSELLRMGFAVGGLVGVAAGRWPALRPVAASPLLVSWFLVILAHAGVDLWNDLFPFKDRFAALGSRLDYIMSRTSELTEMLVAGAGCCYAWLARRTLAPG